MCNNKEIFRLNNDKLESLMSKCSIIPRDVEIFYKRSQGETLKSIGDPINLTKERVRQITRKVDSEIRKNFELIEPSLAEMLCDNIKRSCPNDFMVSSIWQVFHIQEPYKFILDGKYLIPANKWNQVDDELNRIKEQVSHVGIVKSEGILDCSIDLSAQIIKDYLSMELGNCSVFIDDNHLFCWNPKQKRPLHNRIMKMIAAFYCSGDTDKAKITVEQIFHGVVESMTGRHLFTHSIDSFKRMLLDGNGKDGWNVNYDDQENKLTTSDDRKELESYLSPSELLIMKTIIDNGGSCSANDISESFKKSGKARITTFVTLNKSPIVYKSGRNNYRLIGR